ncbi:DUF4873 domain-containing protein [Streptomyces fuscigenes]|uniref:DUF4873 domain-containing protein n=1 Tax=Streptomyces fuscigenes TaxID=1528880 RepID=UPI001F3F0D91|nr:DUF4873 domain-containing protein [Streptomyces fuscigenes]MCF3963392.1 DUF4873 domain-containing protein [Streptomyces fuscigenes]
MKSYTGPATVLINAREIDAEVDMRQRTESVQVGSDSVPGPTSWDGRLTVPRKDGWAVESAARPHLLIGDRAGSFLISGGDPGSGEFSIQGSGEKPF